MSELAVVESVESVETPLALPTGAPARRPGLIQSVLFAVLGVALLYVGLVPMGHVVGLVKVPVVLASFVAFYLAIDRAGKALRGAHFDTGFWLCCTWLVLLILATIFASWLPLGEYKNASKTIGTPGNLRPDLFSSHPLGTNNLSLDILSRSIYAARVSLSTALFAVAVSMVVGVTIGMLAGFYRGWLDTVVGVGTDATLAIPALVLLIAIAAVLGVPKTVPQAIYKEGIALAIVGIPTMIRLARANTLNFANREFVVASEALGAKKRRILAKHLLPNVMLPIISYAFIIIAVLIVAEGSLAFLGLGLQQPQPSWGNMIAEGSLTVLRKYPHIPLVPGVFMFLTVFSFNRIGERARRAWDPRQAKI
jgi:peptide/nickel transport system permease protein